MAFTPVTSLASDEDVVRMLIGDHTADGSGRNLIEDAIITGFLGKGFTVRQTASLCLRAISTNADSLEILYDRMNGAMSHSDITREWDRKATELND